MDRRRIERELIDALKAEGARIGTKDGEPYISLGHYYGSGPDEIYLGRIADRLAELMK